MTRTGRLLTIFWCVMSVISVSSLTSVISARLTVDQLAYTTIDSLSQLRPSELCIENSYPAVEGYVSDMFSLEDDLAGAGVKLGSVQECAEAVLSGEVRAYLTDKPLVSWLAYQYYGNGDLYVSDTLRANPLTLAYPSGSTLRPVVDLAVIRMLTNTTWTVAQQRLEAAWFPEGLVSAPDKVSKVNVPTLVAACVLVLAWLAGIVLVVCTKALRAVRGGQPLRRVAAKVRSRLTQGTCTLGSAAPAGGNCDAAEAPADAEQAGVKADCDSSPRVESFTV